ncbi:hypothetical protein [Arthrobacter sp. UYEF3]|uniref:hypothetical protein n=1 Tax=Arthrobacter sp. UYEF3 TaxID=1756365 RepID=UPI0033960C13
MSRPTSWGLIAPPARDDGAAVIGSGLAKDLDLAVGSRVSVGGTEPAVAAVVPEQW